jgi:hypothetical protein
VFLTRCRLAHAALLTAVTAAITAAAAAAITAAAAAAFLVTHPSNTANQMCRLALAVDTCHCCCHGPQCSCNCLLAVCLQPRSALCPATAAAAAAAIQSALVCCSPCVHCCVQHNSKPSATATVLESCCCRRRMLLLLLTHPSSATQQCTPRRPEYTHRMCWKPKSSRSAVSSTWPGHVQQTCSKHRATRNCGPGAQHLSCGWLRA